MSKKNIILRPYQKQCVKIINSMKKGAGLVVLATGLGKTVIFSSIDRKGRVLILSHREELVHQPEKYYDCSFGVERAEEQSNGEDVISASVQTLIRRLDKFDPYEFDIIITDEAHHAVAPSYRKIYDYFKPRLHIGFTATPNRADKIGLHKIFNQIIYNRDLKWGIENGYLSHIECKRVQLEYNVSNVKKVAGDFNLGQLSEVMNVDNVVEAIADVFNNYAIGQTVIFAVDVEHTFNITEAINNLCGEGTAEAITGTTENRSEILDRFKNKTTRCLVNCMVLTEGTDLPMIETVIMARPTSNQSLYTQAVGRALRLFPGKEKALLIDCVGVSDKLKICTAPTLIGLDPDVVPDSKISKVEGDLLELESKIDMLCDTPESWILQARAVDLFAEDVHLDTLGLNFVMKPNGSLSCSLGDNQRIYISTPDEIGLCEIVYEKKSYGRKKELHSKNKYTPQEAVNITRRMLENKFMEQRPLWDMKVVNKWGNAKISDAQKKYIKSLTSTKKYKEEHGKFDFDLDKLNKYEASLLINKLKG